MMVLYSGTTCPYSHRCRFVLFEKGMDFEIRDVDLYNKPEDINVMNPYGQVPILVERDLILYESNIINEYIDERFPHPQLMPGDPVDRARVRLFLLNFEKELFVHVSTLESRASKGNDKALEKARSHIKDRLTQLAPIFLKNKFMLGDNFSMLDVAIAPLLWRLDYYGIDLSKNAAPLLKYAERIFSRPAYIEALTPSEKVMRKYSSGLMNAIDSTSTRPYLIRALYEWCTDNGLTPYVAVSVDDSVQVPREYVKNNEIVLNISFDATSSLKLGNDFIEFKARFAGSSRDIMVPIVRVIAIYARENGQGMAFPMGVQPHQDEAPSAPTALAVVGVSASAPSTNPAPLQSASDNRVVQLVPTDDQEPPKPPSGPRPSLKRVK